NGALRSQAADLISGSAVRCRQIQLLEDRLAIRVEHLQREAGEPFAEPILRAVVNDDAVDRQFAAKIDLPPGVRGNLLAVTLAAVVEIAADVTVDRSAGVAAIGGIPLRGLALAGDVAAGAVDLDLGQRQRLPSSGQLDADEATALDFALWPCGRQFLWETCQKRL